MGKGQSLGELCVCAWSEVEGRAACAGLFGARLLASTWLHMAGRPRYASLSQSFAVALCRLLLLQSLATPRAPAHEATAQPCISTVARCVNPPRSRERGENAGGGQSGWRAGATGSPRPGSLTTWFPPSGTGFAQQVGAMTSGKQRREGAWRGVPHSDLQRLSPLRSGARCPHAWATRGTSLAPRLHKACTWGVEPWDPSGGLSFCGSFSPKKSSSLSAEGGLRLPFDPSKEPAHGPLARWTWAAGRSAEPRCCCSLSVCLRAPSPAPEARGPRLPEGPNSNSVLKWRRESGRGADGWLGRPSVASSQPVRSAQAPVQTSRGAHLCR